MASLNTLLGAAQQGGGASISVGRIDTGEAISTSCTGGGKNTVCTITHDGSGGTNLDANTDQVVLLNAWNEVQNKQVCTFAAPCSISNVQDTSFDIASKDIPDGASYSNATIVEVSRAATVTQAGHGLNIGDQVKLENCTVGNESNTYNIDALKGTVLGLSLIHI